MHHDVAHKNTNLKRHNTRLKLKNWMKRRSWMSQIMLSSPRWTPQRCPIAMARECDSIAML
jgi:hypothetical protein